MELLKYDHLGAVIENTGLARDDLARLAPRLQKARQEVLSDVALWNSGDKVPDVLRSLGYQVEELDVDAIAAGGLDRFDAIVLGIRAYNTNPRLMSLNDRLLA